MVFVGTTIKINVPDSSAGFQTAYLLHFLDVVLIQSGALIAQSRFALTVRVSIVNLIFFFSDFFFYNFFNCKLQTDSNDDILSHINQRHSAHNVIVWKCNAASQLTCWEPLANH